MVMSDHRDRVAGVLAIQLAYHIIANEAVFACNPNVSQEPLRIEQTADHKLLLCLICRQASEALQISKRMSRSITPESPLESLWS